MTSIIKVNEIQDAGGNTILSSNGTSTFTSNLPDNTPAWLANSNSVQTFSLSSTTKINFTTEIFDTDNAYDTTTSKFTVPSGKAGKYFVSGQMAIQNSANYNEVQFVLYKNGAEITNMQTRMRLTSDYFNATSAQRLHVAGIIDLAEADYLEFYVYLNSASGGTPQSNSGQTSFRGYKLIGA